MDYKDSVENEIEGGAEALDRRKKLWGKIAKSFDQGGQDAIQSILEVESMRITSEYNRALERIRKIIGAG